MRIELTFQDPVPDSPDLSVELIIEDVSRADADAVRIASQTVALSANDIDPSGTCVVELDASNLQPHHNIRAHLSNHAAGEIHPGDLISTVATPVGNQPQVRLTLKRV